MRISELSARSGVSVATIKYYLRERVLPEGERTSATQATYDVQCGRTPSRVHRPGSRSEAK